MEELILLAKIAIFVLIGGTIFSGLLLCMIYQLNKNQQIRATQVALRVEEVKDRLLVTTNAEAKDETVKRLKEVS